MTWRIKTPSGKEVVLDKSGETLTIEIAGCRQIVFTYNGEDKSVDMEIVGGSLDKDTLTEKITKAIERYGEGHARQFALFGGGKYWLAMVGASEHVLIGEAPAEFEGVGDTPEEAVDALIHLIHHLPSKDKS